MVVTYHRFVATDSLKTFELISLKNPKARTFPRDFKLIKSRVVSI